MKIPIPITNTIEYFTVNLKRSDSLPTNPTAAQAIAILCGEIILPTTPPTEFAAKNSTSGISSCLAVSCCNVPKRRFELVSLPVRNTPSQPTMGEKNAKASPVCARAKARVADETL